MQFISYFKKLYIYLMLAFFHVSNKYQGSSIKEVAIIK